MLCYLLCISSFPFSIFTKSINSNLFTLDYSIDSPLESQLFCETLNEIIRAILEQDIILL